MPSKYVSVYANEKGTKPISKEDGRKRNGAKKGNLNSTKNGQQMYRLTIGSLPDGMKRHQSTALKYRRELEAATLEAKGEVTFLDAHLIDEAATAELNAGVCRWLMNTRLEKMTVSDIAKCSDQILKARTIRNKAVEKLKLEKPPEDPWELLDAEVTVSKSKARKRTIVEVVEEDEDSEAVREFLNQEKEARK